MHILHQSFLTFPKYSKQKFLTKFQFKFLSLPPRGRGYKKMRSLKNHSESLSCKIWILEHTKISLNPKDEPSTSKIERVTGFFVSQVKSKSRIGQFFKSQKRKKKIWDLKIWQNCDFALTQLTKISVTRSIFEVEGSSFGFRLIFVCSKIHILQLKLSEWFFNDLIFYTPLPNGGGF